MSRDSLTLTGETPIENLDLDEFVEGVNSTSWRDLRETDDIAWGDKYRYQGLSDSNEPYYSKFFSQPNVDAISKRITTKLWKIMNRGITVPDSTITSVMDGIYTNEIATDEVMVQMVVNLISDQISSDLEMESTNKKLNIWVTKYDGDLKRTNTVKIRTDAIGGISYEPRY